MKKSKLFAAVCGATVMVSLVAVGLCGPSYAQQLSAQGPHPVVSFNIDANARVDKTIIPSVPPGFVMTEFFSVRLGEWTLDEYLDGKFVKRLVRFHSTHSRFNSGLVLTPGTEVRVRNDANDAITTTMMISGFVQPVGTPCEKTDADGDGDIDLFDIANAYNCFNGPGKE